MQFRLRTLSIRHRLFMRFSLAGLFVFVTLFSAACGWLVNCEGSRRHRAIASLQRPGVGLFFEHQGAGANVYRPDAKPPGTVFMKRLLGEYYETSVIQIEVLPSGNFTDADTKTVAVFKELDWLAINDSKITDEGLRHLESLKQLGRLDVEGCRLSSTGIARLRKALPNTDVYSDFDE
jgi:hypothetical protein